MALLRFCSAGPKCLKSGQAIANSVIVRPVLRRNVLSGDQSWLRVASGYNQQRDYHQSRRRDGQLEPFLGQNRQASSSTTETPLRDPLNTGFADPVAAFKSKTLIELIRAYVVYMICSSSYLVNNNMQVSAPFSNGLRFIIGLVPLSRTANQWSPPPPPVDGREMGR